MESLNLQCNNRLFPSPTGLCIKTRLSTQSLIRELFFILMRSKSHFHKKDCVLGLILKVRVFELASGLLKHFKDQPFPSCCLITQRYLNQHQLPKSSRRHRSHGHQHHQGSFVTLQRALTSLKVGV